MTFGLRERDHVFPDLPVAGYLVHMAEPRTLIRGVAQARTVEDGADVLRKGETERRLEPGVQIHGQPRSTLVDGQYKLSECSSS